MFLAHAIAEGEDGLICDLAEYYGIHDYRSFGALHIATLASGLSLDSRTKRKISGVPITRQEYLLAYIADRIANLVWMQSEDGAKNSNRPKMILPGLLGQAEEETEDNTAFGYETSEDFENAMDSLNYDYGA